MKIDVFRTSCRRDTATASSRWLPPGACKKRMSGIPVLVDLDLRFTMMDRWNGYVQVLTLANPSHRGGRPASLQS